MHSRYEEFQRNVSIIAECIHVGEPYVVLRGRELICEGDSVDKKMAEFEASCIEWTSKKIKEIKNSQSVEQKQN